MTITALQAFRIEVDLILGKIDLSPLAGGEKGKKSQAIVETASIALKKGMFVKNLLPGYWIIRDLASPLQDHPRLSLQSDGVHRLDTFDIKAEDLPMVIPGLMRVEK